MTTDIKGQRHDRTALILYGSETGNSQDAAEELGRMAERLHFVTRVSEMDLIELNRLRGNTVVIFIISTTGQGEFPRNARNFWKTLLRKRLPPDCLNHVHFTTFGLGDTSYPKYNWTARKLHKRLEQLGAQEFYPRGEGDEQHEEGIEGTFLPWSADLRKHLLSLYPLPEGVTPIPQEVFIPPKHQLSLAEGAAPVASSDGSTISRNGPNASEQPQNKSSSLNLTQTETTSSRSAEDLDMAFPLKLRLPIDHQPEFCPQLKEPAPDHTPIVDSTLPSYDLLPIKDAFPLRLLENRRITPDAHWQDVRLLTFITYECHTYQPGDAITIYPKNFPEDVQALIDLMEWNEVADKNLAFEATAPDFFHADNLVMKPHGMYPLPKTTLRQLLMHNLDITAIPKRTFFDNMAHYTENQMHKERLLEFSNPAFTDEFFDYTTRPRRSILEVLQDFPSVKLPWKYATSLFPLIRGRQYSIASGGIQQVDPKQPEFRKFEILVALVRYKTILRKVRQGLCSRYLASLEEGKAIRVTMTKNDTFYQQAREKGDCIMIAPGTGVAPCRSLIWERAMHWFDKPDHVGKVYLFFGNRNEKADYFFKDEWKAASLRVEVFTAFSRDQPEKIYIQDIIRREKKLILDLMERGPIIYICGSSGSMPKQVRQALIDIWAEGMEEKFGEIAARKMAEITMQEYEKKGGIIQETW